MSIIMRSTILSILLAAIALPAETEALFGRRAKVRRSCRRARRAALDLFDEAVDGTVTCTECELPEGTDTTSFLYLLLIGSYAEFECTASGSDKTVDVDLIGLGSRSRTEVCESSDDCVEYDFAGSAFVPGYGDAVSCSKSGGSSCAVVSGAASFPFPGTDGCSCS